MLDRKNLFEKKLREALCGRVHTKEFVFTTNRVHINILVGDLTCVKEKYVLSKIRIAGYIDFGGDPKTRKELCDVEYKKSLDNDGLISYFLNDSLWLLLLSKLKHFGLDKVDVEIGDKPHYVKLKRFFAHSKRYVLKDADPC